ncbi:MAG: RNA polymerase sigma factor [Stappiaceae bacterium]
MLTSDLDERARQGDRVALQQLIDQAKPQMMAVVQRMVGHPEDVEDIVQDALVSAVEKLDTFRRDASFSTWLTAIASRKAIDHLRYQQRWRTEAQVAYANLCARSEELSREVMSAYADPAFAFEVRQHIAYCFTCVGRSLPPEELAALVLRDVIDMSGREAATALGISDSVLRHRLSAARRAMSEKYEGLCALVNKQGICHQCKGLQAIAPPDRKGTDFPDIEDFAERCSIVRNAPPDGGMAVLHSVFWRRTKQIEERGEGDTEPLSGCGDVNGET